jgi:hypothetical protein
VVMFDGAQNDERDVDGYGDAVDVGFLKVIQYEVSVNFDV